MSIWKNLSQYSDIKIDYNKQSALKDADFIFFLTGDNKLYIDEEDLSVNKKNYKVLSAVPADYSLFDKVICEKNNSLIQKQSENFLHIAKSCLLLLSNKK